MSPLDVIAGVAKADQWSGYPLAAYNFRVDLDGQTVTFSEVTGLKIEYETTTYRHGLSFFEGEDIVRYRLGKYAPITLKKGIAPNITTLRAWLDSGETRKLDVSLCDENGAAVVTWHVGKAVPVKLDAPALNAAGNEVAIETLEILGAQVSLESR